jgi:hypothetical protein
LDADSEKQENGQQGKSHVGCFSVPKCNEYY